MSPQVRGQVPLPGATESLLQATARLRERMPPRRVDYLALSILRKDDGTWSVTKMALDAATGRVVPTLLDGEIKGDSSAYSLAMMLRHWAQELCLDELDGQV